MNLKDKYPDLNPAHVEWCDKIGRSTADHAGEAVEAQTDFAPQELGSMLYDIGIAFHSTDGTVPPPSRVTVAALRILADALESSIDEVGEPPSMLPEAGDDHRPTDTISKRSPWDED